MFDRRRLIRQGVGAALLFTWLFVALCLGGYDPCDPPGAAAEPPNIPVHNPCGPFGAWLAHVLFQTIGWASFVLLLGLGVGVLLLIRRRSVPEPGLRMLGIGMVLAVASVLAQVFGSTLPRSPAVGGGGTLGALIEAFLSSQFGSIGMVLILVAVGLIGLVLCHELLFVYPIRELFWLFRARPRAPRCRRCPRGTR